MPRRSDTLEVVVLAIELLRRIPLGRKVTARELHEQLKATGIERDLRTIQRQLETLSDHFGIERDERSKPYGYRWGSKAGLAIPGLSAQESLLLTLAEDHLKNLLPAPMMRSMQGFFEQARHNLGPEASNKLDREWPGKVRVVGTSQPLLPPTIRPGVLETVSEALYRNRHLHVDYENAEGERRKAEIMPLGLAQQGPRLYLVCRFQGYDNERSLALHRIHSAGMSTLRFDRPTDFNLKQYDDDGRFGFGEGERVRLTFRIEREAGAHLSETPLSEDQEIEELDDGRLKISATVVDSGMLEWWLRGFGEVVTDIERDPVAS